MFSKARSKFIEFLKQGTSPQKLALCVAFGICLGIIPLIGTTSLLCLGAALIFRLNISIIQLVNYLVYPLQLILFIPFLKFGSMWFSNDKFNYSLNQILEMIKSDLLKAIGDLFWINMSGLLLWIILAPFLFALIYFSCRPVFTHLALKINAEK